MQYIIAFLIIALQFVEKTVNLRPSIDFQPVTEGEDATFNCSLKVVENITFAWYVNQQKQDGQNGKEFTIYNIKRSQKGSNVTCEVLLNGLTMKNTTKVVDVYYKPSMVTIDPGESIIEVNIIEKNYSIKCKTRDIGVPSGNLKWLRNPHQENILASSEQGKAITLSLKTMKRADTGYYTCTAWNNIGRVSKTVLLKVLEKPDPPKVTTDSTPNAITVTWTQTFNGNKPIKEYALKIEGNVRDTFKRHQYLKGEDRKYTFLCLSSNVNYTLRIWAMNELGWSDAAVKVTITKRYSKEDGNSTTILPWVIAAATAVSMLILFIVIAALLLKTGKITWNEKSLRDRNHEERSNDKSNGIKEAGFPSEYAELNVISEPRIDHDYESMANLYDARYEEVKEHSKYENVTFIR